jgi:hypothetical protein
MVEASFDDVVATPQLHTEMPYTPRTCAQFAHSFADFPKPIRVAGVNFYRRTDIRAWLKAHEARKAKDRKRR